MSEHPTLDQPSGTVRQRAGEPSGDADITAAFADLVCADHELLRAEFEAIITANYPDTVDGPQRREPAVSVLTRTDRVSPRCGPARPPHHRRRRGTAGVLRLQARQRGPPFARQQHTCRPERPGEEEVVDRPTPQ